MVVKQPILVPPLLKHHQRMTSLYDMVQNIEFKNVATNFQTWLSDDTANIKKNPKLLIPADKTSNLHELTTDECNKLLAENICNAYKNPVYQQYILLRQKQKLLCKI